MKNVVSDEEGDGGVGGGGNHVDTTSGIDKEVIGILPEINGALSLDFVIQGLFHNLSPGKPLNGIRNFGGSLSPVDTALKVAREISWIRRWLLEDESTVADALTSPTAMHDAHGEIVTESQFDGDCGRRGVLNADFEDYKLVMPVFQHEGFTAGLIMVRTKRLKSALVVRKERELRRYVVCERTGDFWSVVRRKEREEVEVVWSCLVKEDLRLKVFVSFDDRVGVDGIGRRGEGDCRLPERMLHHTVILERRFCRNCDDHAEKVCDIRHENIKLDFYQGPREDRRSMAMMKSTQCQKGRFYGRSAVTIYDPTNGHVVLNATNLVRSSTAEELDADTLLTLKSEVMHECDFTVKCTKTLVPPIARASTPTSSTLTDVSKPIEAVPDTTTIKRGRGRARTPEEREQMQRAKELAKKEKQERKRVEQARRAAIQKVKNRISAARCNRRRKAKIEATKNELAELLKVKPTLEARWEQLVIENEQLRQAVARQRQFSL